MIFKKIIIYGVLHRILSTNRLSRCVGLFANAHVYPPFLRFIIKLYISIFKIDMKEYDFDMSQVKTFNQFFTRKLIDGMRKWEEGIASPVDGFMLSHGKINNNMIFQVKGKEYQESELTGQEPMPQGSFVNLYLSPANYHRVHAPFDMHIKKVTHIPGKLLSVSKRNAKTVDDLYSKNERVILSGDSAYGHFHFVFVGATNVGSIKLSFLPELKSNLKNSNKKEWIINHSSEKGVELGLFEMGSTVIFLIEDELLEFCKSTLLENPVKMGTKLA